ncbi:MAG: DUF3293 domain-containing protein [Acidobacteria bacterium]|nr:DUF3293 domain-containing protein [Acidobacteriota bacterium]
MFLPRVGTAADRSWEEESLMMLGISRGAALALGRKYGQLVILFGETDRPATL